MAETSARRRPPYGIGLTAAAGPSVSNMGYITTVLTPEERRKAGPKNGAQATATISLDPLGGVSAYVASVPQDHALCPQPRPGSSKVMVWMASASGIWCVPK